MKQGPEGLEESNTEDVGVAELVSKVDVKSKVKITTQAKGTNAGSQRGVTDG